MAVLLTNQDQGANDALEAIKASIAGYWLEAKPLSWKELAAYRASWQRKRSTLETLQTPFKSPGEKKDQDKGTPVAPAKPIQQWTWREYYGHIASKGAYAPQHYSVIERARVIRSVRSLFVGERHFDNIEPDGRNKIAGTLHPRYGRVDGVDYLLFGSMWPARKFKAVLKHNYKNLSLALDAIPSVGEVSKDDYVRYAEIYQKASPSRVAEFAAATRLLAMKRPDTFVCLDARNKAGLCDAFGISRDIDYETYWDSLIERVKQSIWWRDPAPRFGIEREVWDARVAFLDSIFYEAKGMPPS